MGWKISCCQKFQEMTTSLWGQENEKPHQNNIDQGEENGGRADILGPAGKFVKFLALPVDNGFHCLIDQFDNQDQEDTS